MQTLSSLVDSGARTRASQIFYKVKNSIPLGRHRGEMCSAISRVPSSMIGQNNYSALFKNELRNEERMKERKKKKKKKEKTRTRRILIIRYYGDGS